MRVVLVAQDDWAVEFLSVLAAEKCEVLGVATGGRGCSAFCKRCVDMGFDLVTSRNQAVVELTVENFAPELLLTAPDLGTSSLFDRLASKDSVSSYRFSFGSSAPGAPWPEFQPIWLESSESVVALLQKDGSEIAARVVPVVDDETAITLRDKHMKAAASLLRVLLTDRGALPSRAKEAEPLHEYVVPSKVLLDWDSHKVERFLRAWTLPPCDPASIEDPVSGETYFLENMQQYFAFRSTLSASSSGHDERVEGAYAADTHFYSNVGGSIIKLQDSKLHAPRNVKTASKLTVVPGAAIGGARQKLRMNEPLIGPNAEQYVSSVLASTWIGVEGPFVKAFEAHVARICGCAAACAVQSGTAALYGAMKALAVSDPSHHVLVPSFTCAAAADAVVHAGGTPICVDCDLDTFGMSTEAVREQLEKNPNVVGVVVAHCYGVPIRDLNEVLGLCRERGLWLCEDACESYGAMMRGPNGTAVPVGSVGTLSVVSARSEKMVGVGEGGAIVGSDTTLVARSRWWCSRAPCRGAGLWRVYEHEGVGQNFRMPEMLGAVGCAAAEMLPTMIERKRQIHGWYEKHMGRPGLEAVKMQTFTPGDQPVWWINSALLPEGISAEKVGMQLMKDFPDIEIRPGFFPCDQMAIFKGAMVGPCPNTDLLYRRLVCLPSSHQLCEPNIERICMALAETVKMVSEAGAS